MLALIALYWLNKLLHCLCTETDISDLLQRCFPELVLYRKLEFLTSLHSLWSFCEFQHVYYCIIIYPGILLTEWCRPCAQSTSTIKSAFSDNSVLVVVFSLLSVICACILLMTSLCMLITSSSEHKLTHCSV